jgi:hypothetical protein
MATMLTPMTFLERLQFAGGQLLGSAVMFWIGWEVLRVIGRKSAERRRHGKYVLGWMFGGWLAGAIYMICTTSSAPGTGYSLEFAISMCGMLLGWPIGMFHGWLVLMVWPVKPHEIK